MTNSRSIRLGANVLAALVVPIAVQAIQFFIATRLHVGAGYFSYVISVASGLLFLLFEFRVYAVLIGVFYAAIMGLALMYLTLAWGVRYLGEGP